MPLPTPTGIVATGATLAGLAAGVAAGLALAAAFHAAHALRAPKDAERIADRGGWS